MAIFMLYTFQILTILIIMSTFEGHVSMSSIFSKFVGLSQEPIIHESVLVMFILFFFSIKECNWLIEILITLIKIIVRHQYELLSMPDYPI